MNSAKLTAVNYFILYYEKQFSKELPTTWFKTERLERTNFRIKPVNMKQCIFWRGLWLVVYYLMLYSKNGRLQKEYFIFSCAVQFYVSQSVGVIGIHHMF